MDIRSSKKIEKPSTPKQKKLKLKRKKVNYKFQKTCAMYGIFDCTCCQKLDQKTNDDNKYLLEAEILNLPSTSKNDNDDNKYAKIEKDEISATNETEKILNGKESILPSTNNRKLLSTIESTQELDNNVQNSISLTKTILAHEDVNNEGEGLLFDTPCTSKVSFQENLLFSSHPEISTTIEKYKFLSETSTLPSTSKSELSSTKSTKELYNNVQNSVSLTSCTVNKDVNNESEGLLCDTSCTLKVPFQENVIFSSLPEISTTNEIYKISNVDNESTLPSTSKQDLLSTESMIKVLDKKVQNLGTTQSIRTNNGSVAVPFDTPSTSKQSFQELLIFPSHPESSTSEICATNHTTIASNSDSVTESEILDYVNSVCVNIKLEHFNDFEQNFLQMMENDTKPIKEIKSEFVDTKQLHSPKTNELQLTIKSNDNRPFAYDILSALNLEDDEEIDVVNLPEEIKSNLLIIPENNAPQLAETSSRIHLTTVEARVEVKSNNQNQDNVQTECSDDEDLIIDILNCDDTEDRTANLLNNIQKNNTNIEPSTENNEDEIIDVENLTDDSPDLSKPQVHHTRINMSLVHKRYREKTRSRLNKRARLSQSVMTIDLINARTDDSVIEITDSPITSKTITEIINVDDDDDVEGGIPLYTSPVRIGLGDCPVCLENLSKNEIMSTICGHVFCSRCIRSVIKTTKKCPNCRKNLTLKSIHPLFI